MTPELSVSQKAGREQRAGILALLAEYNRQRTGFGAIKPLSIMLRGAGGEVVRGLHATSAYAWLVIELVFVPEAMRGRGVALTP